MASTSRAQSVEDAIKEVLNPQTFNSSMLDEGALVMVTSGASRRLYDRDEITDLVANIRSSGSNSELSGFKVLNKTEIVDTEPTLMGSDQPFPTGDLRPTKIVAATEVDAATAARINGRLATKLFRPG
jgi:aminocarboxymuconate-semialdehyde decarboxylase